MKISYRQGIIKSQLTAVNGEQIPAFLIKDDLTNYIKLYVNASSTIVTFAHGNANYLFEESNTIEHAWGPFTPPLKASYWLYWDLNIETGIRTFGHTTLVPIISNVAPVYPETDQHWFNKADNIMYVWNGLGWTETIRLFAGIYSGNKITPYKLESQVNLTGNIYAGFILFDDENLPIKKTNSNHFLTTETQFYTTKSNTSPVKFDTTTVYVKAAENIPEYKAVAYYDDDSIMLASYTDQYHRPAAGLIKNETFKDQTTAIVSDGYITNVAWDWSGVPVSTPLYLGQHGTLQLLPPKSGFVQKIGTVVSADTILLNIESQIIYNTADHINFSIPVAIDTVSGKLYTSYPNNQTLPTVTAEPNIMVNGVNTPVPAPDSTANTMQFAGYTYIQKTALDVWTLGHNLATTKVFVQVYDTDGSYIVPEHIIVADANNIKVIFNEPTSGTAQVVLFLKPGAVDVISVDTPVYEYSQQTPSNNWIINHGISEIPITRVFIEDLANLGTYIVIHPLRIIHNKSSKQTIIKFNKPTVGKVRFI
jgi:hypothetical protein